MMVPLPLLLIQKTKNNDNSRGTIAGGQMDQNHRCHLTTALQHNIEKKTNRDADRHQQNEKLK